MDKLKILHVLSYSHYPERWYSIIRQMMQYFDIYVLYADIPSYNMLNKYMPTKVYSVESIDFGKPLGVRNTMFKSITKLNEVFKIVKPDLIHIQTHYFLSNYQALALAKKRKIPSMLDIQGLIENKNLAIDKVQNIYLWTPLMHWLLKNVDGIRFVSSSDYALLKKRYDFIGQKSKIIYNFIELEKYRVSQKIHPSMIWHGRLVKKKRIDLIIKVLSRIISEYLIKDLKFYLIGYGPEYPKIMKLIKDFHLFKNITYIPYLNTDDLINYLSKAEVIPFVSSYEGNPFSLLEAAACGVFPIGFKTPGTQETIRMLNGALIEDGDIIGLAQKIVEVLEKGYDPWVLRRLVETYFSPRVILSNLKDYYEKIICFAK
ncbi:MAG: glycosyltransferase family 4 protein [Candidatus Jordarchaeaceae archaeon]